MIARLLCRLRLRHRYIGAYVPTGNPRPPLYRYEVACIYCLKVNARSRDPWESV